MSEALFFQKNQIFFLKPLACSNFFVLLQPETVTKIQAV